MLEITTTKCSNCWTKLLTEHYISEDQSVNCTLHFRGPSCKLNIRLHINITEDKSIEGTSGGLEKTSRTVFQNRQPRGGGRWPRRRGAPPRSGGRHACQP